MDNEQIETGSKNIEKVLNFIERISNVIDKYGIKKIFSAIILLFIAVVVGYYAFNPEAMVKKVQEVIEKQTTEEVALRMKADPEIRSTLIDLRLETKSDRAFIFETHNGGSNLTGLKFLYVDMTYDEPVKGLDRLSKEYLNLRTSNYPMINYIYGKSFWYGPITDLEEIDEEIYCRLKKSGVKNIAIIMMYGKTKPIGCLGIAYYDSEPLPTDDVKQTLLLYSNTIDDILDNE